jgi:hypothetical protein
MRNEKLFQKISSSLTVLLLIFLFSSCKKSEVTDPPEPQFSFLASDSIVFIHSGAITYTVSVQAEAGKELGARLQNLPTGFSVSETEIIIPANESRSFSVSLNQIQVQPGTYPCDLNVTIYNTNVAPKRKTVQLVFAPNCAYAFQNHVNGRITYASNGIAENRNINCVYTAQGQLAVSGLSPYTMIFNVDCEAQTVNMQPLTNNGFYMTANGQINGSEINFQLYSDGTLFANGLIRP